MNVRARARNIASTLTLLSVLPLTLMFAGAAISIHLWLSAETSNDLSRRAKHAGAMVAALVAQEALLGNDAAIYRAMEAVTSHDKAIASLSVLNEKYETLIVVGNNAPAGNIQWVDVPVGSVHFQKTQKVVRVGMSRVYAVAQTEQLRWRLLGALGGVWLACLSLGIWLAVRAYSALRRATVGLQHQNGWGSPGGNHFKDLERAAVDLLQSRDEAKADTDKAVASRTLKLQKALDRATRLDREKQLLLRHAQDAVERDRHRISMEIHDGVGSALVAIKLWAESIDAKAKSIGSTEIAEMSEHLVKTAHDAYRDTRLIVKELRPELLETMDLQNAIEEYIQVVRLSNPRSHIEFSAAALPTLNDIQANALFRTAQEALINSVKHSGASKIVVRLEAAESPWHARLTVGDNGRGIQTASASGRGYGLLGMRERVASADGVLSVVSNSGGTLITVAL